MATTPDALTAGQLEALQRLVGPTWSLIEQLNSAAAARQRLAADAQREWKGPYADQFAAQLAAAQGRSTALISQLRDALRHLQRTMDTATPMGGPR